MKLIRLTDDRYILDTESDRISSQQFEEISRYWEEWWERQTVRPSVIVFGGSAHSLVYEDRRDSDLEARVKRLEEHTHISGLDWSGEPRYDKDEKTKPLGGIEQYQAEGR